MYEDTHYVELPRFVATIKEAHDAVLLICGSLDKELTAEFIVALTRCKISFGGYARYLALAAFREDFRIDERIETGTFDFGEWKEGL